MSKETVIPLPPKKDRSSPQRRKRRRRSFFLKFLACLFILGLVAGMTGLAIAYFYAKPRLELADSFNLDEIDDLEVASLILDRNGEEIGRIFVQNRQPIPISEVAPHFVQALLAAEDSRFYTHDGVDYMGILRAIWLNLKAGEVTQGASTITQQLARNAFELKERSVSRKVTEAFLARRIEREIGDKEKILELYLNRIYFGSGYYGISAAANGYFGKDPKDLTIPESAAIAGVIRNPTFRSPHNYPEAAKKTRDYVLSRMRDEGMLTEEQLKQFQNEPLLTVEKGSASGRSKFVWERVRQQVIDLVGYENAIKGGFRIHTTIDSRIQHEAEESLTRQLDRVEKRPGYKHQTREIFKELKASSQKNGNEGQAPPQPAYLQGAVLVVDNRTGGILAFVGGRDFNDSMFDRTSLARRSPGTAFIPFVYAAAFENGMFPGSLIDDSPIDNRRVMIGGTAGILGEWGAENLENTYEGDITARQGLAKSKGAATVRLGIQTGLEKVVGLAERSGMTFEGDLKNFNASLLGRNPVSMEELCLAYTIFPNGGGHPARTFIISRIEDIHGQEIFVPNPNQSAARVIDPYTAYQVTSCLEDALRHGTGQKAGAEYGLKDFPAAGKSGTEYDFTDNWFAGFTSEVTCAVWAGFDQPKAIYPGAFSNETVLPVWTAVMNAAAEVTEPVAFAPPADAMKVEICSLSGELATDACYEVDRTGRAAKQIRSTYVEYLRPGTRIDSVCHVHGGPGAKPRTAPPRIETREAPNSLTNTGRSGGGGVLIAQRLVSSEPVIPVGPTILGEDPYDSLVPKLRARALISEKPSANPLDETPDPSSGANEGAGDDLSKEPLVARPVGGAAEPMVARPIASGDSPVVARPIGEPDGAAGAEDETPAATNRVRLEPPKPIQFD
ncbi:MAG: transglycosylase domain-containing protein [Verrucomicrobiae bacterium]|nr:transglycosylase domain-containing protein [Verrucomicrobiae bacterium]